MRHNDDAYDIDGGQTLEGRREVSGPGCAYELGNDGAGGLGYARSDHIGQHKRVASDVRYFKLRRAHLFDEEEERGPCAYSEKKLPHERPGDGPPRFNDFTVGTFGKLEEARLYLKHEHDGDDEPANFSCKGSSGCAQMSHGVTPQVALDPCIVQDEVCNGNRQTDREQEVCAGESRPVCRNRTGDAEGKKSPRSNVEEGFENVSDHFAGDKSAQKPRVKKEYTGAEG